MCSSSDSMAESPKDERKSNRRSNKPLMEKRRRARINECLTELKGLVLQAMKKDSTQYSKLEKADILEMTVKHLKLLQRQHVAASISTDPFVMNKYRAGFNECAGEVARYMDSATGVDRGVKNRVLNHLANCVTHVTTTNQPAQVHPALIQPLHVQMPPTNQLGVSAFSITCTPNWNVIGSNNITNVTLSGNEQHVPPSSPPYSTKIEYSTVGRISDPDARSRRPQCIVSPMDTICDVKEDSTWSDDADNCSSLDLSVKNHCDRQSPKRSPDPVSDFSIKEEHKPPCFPEMVLPIPQFHGPAHASNDAMWRPW